LEKKKCCGKWFCKNKIFDKYISLIMIIFYLN
jgi:hypothetical protein